MILITGASGKVGSEAARLLGAQRRPTRALVRDASPAPHADVEIAIGDFDRPVTRDTAVRGIETVILVSPAMPDEEIAVIASAARQAVGTSSRSRARRRQPLPGRQDAGSVRS